MLHKQVAQNEYVSLIYEDDILHGKYLIKKLDIEVAKSVMDLQIRTFGTEINYIITDLSIVKHVTKEARDYFVREEFTRNLCAGAFITPTILHKLMFTFFMSFNKPVVPSAFFTNQLDALLWIKKYQKVQPK